MTDLFSKLEALQGELPDTPYTYKPLTAPQFEELEGHIYRMGPQIDGTPAWPPEQMLEWLQQQPPHIRGVAIAMMRRIFRLERVGIPSLPQAIPGRQKATKQMATPLQPTLPLLSADGRPVGKCHLVDGLVPVSIDQSGTIRCAITGRTLFIAPGSSIDRANPGAAEQLNKTYKPALHQVVADHRQIEAGAGASVTQAGNPVLSGAHLCLHLLGSDQASGERGEGGGEKPVSTSGIAGPFRCTPSVFGK